jgi:pilus assembly protein CpaE
VAVYAAPSLAAAVERSRHVEPDIVLLDLSQDRDLALEVARELRHPRRRIVGLYNPLVMRDQEIDLLRRATRAGVGDFVPLPASEAEIEQALDAALASRGPAPERREGRLVTFFSHKGGVGTTTLAVNAALELTETAAGPEGVALCDAVLQLGDAAALLGMRPDHDLADLARDLDGPGALDTHLERHGDSGLRVLASPRDPRRAEEISPEDLSRVLIGLRRRFGTVVVDAPKRLDLMALAVLDLSEVVLLVTEAVTPTVVATARLLELLEDQGLGGDRVRVVVNDRFPPRTEQLGERALIEYLGRPVDHVVPYDGAAVHAVNRGEPLVLSRDGSLFQRAVAELVGSLVEGPPL